ncbi:GlsB/YeaQ/YmgE family stress response membrane protein [Nonomuraea sp. H19]|uniref:GlsB/YeaQ/YmgE family stress response membrane protein n=1 Tax=Nonomuraea sp. H19 TaxID=3452206 RepID=UPI003F8AACC7
MGIIAWIILGLVAGLIARMLVPGKDSQGLIITLVLGIAGALLGGFVATEVFHVSGIQGFFHLSTWICAIAGAAVLLLAYNLINGRRTGRWAGRR